MQAMTAAQQVAELIERREALRVELLNAAEHMHGTEWHRDRVREMQHYNRSLARLGVVPADQL